MSDDDLKTSVTEMPTGAHRLGSDIRFYTREECATFRKTKERFGGLSNMASGFPIVVNDIPIRTSEALYQACRFPRLPEVQRLIIDERSPMAAKMKSKPYRNHTRLDWESNVGTGVVRHMIMSWCLKVKLAQNWGSFSDLLLSTGDMEIVEDSARDDHWGAIPIANGRLRGVNALGRLLMELRELLKEDSASLKTIIPPGIDNMILCGEPIREIQRPQNASPTGLSRPKLSLPFSAEHLNDSSSFETIYNTNIREKFDLGQYSSTPESDEPMGSDDAPSQMYSSVRDELYLCVKRLACQIGCFKGKGDFKDILGVTLKTATLWVERLEADGLVERQSKLYKVRSDSSCPVTAGSLLTVSAELANTIKDLIVDLLKEPTDNLLGAKDIADAMGVPPGQATKWLSRLVEEGEIYRGKDRKYIPKDQTLL